MQAQPDYPGDEGRQVEGAKTGLVDTLGGDGGFSGFTSTTVLYRVLTKPLGYQFAPLAMGSLDPIN